MQQKITPFLMFNGKSEEAANFYVSIFKNSKIKTVKHLGGAVKSVTFEIEGQDFFALDGGPPCDFTMAISLFVDCKGQQEVDELWEKLSAGGEKLPCGWLRDKYGLCWQIIPSELGQLMGDMDAEKSGRVMQAMMKMQKIDIETIKRAYDGKSAA